jgi:hypothetical protein
MFPEKKDILIYGAGKTWAAKKLVDLRDNHGFNIISRWIDLDEVLSDPTAEFDYENTDFSYLNEGLWDKGCKIDATMCDLNMTMAQPEDGEKHSGSLVEMGHTSACYAYIQVQKPVYLVGTCKSFEQVGHSDRAFKFQKCFHHFDTDDYIDGANAVIEHYQKNYARDWVLWRAYLKKNKMIKEMHDYCVATDKTNKKTA